MPKNHKPRERNQTSFQLDEDVRVWIRNRAIRESTSFATVMRQILRKEMEASK